MRTGLSEAMCPRTYSNLQQSVPILARYSKLCQLQAVAAAGGMPRPPGAPPGPFPPPPGPAWRPYMPPWASVPDDPAGFPRFFHALQAVQACSVLDKPWEARVRPGFSTFFSCFISLHFGLLSKAAATRWLYRHLQMAAGVGHRWHMKMLGKDISIS